MPEGTADPVPGGAACDVLLKRLDDRVDDTAMRAFAAFHVDVRLFVGMAPLVGSRSSVSLGLPVRNWTPGVATGCPFCENVHRARRATR